MKYDITLKNITADQIKRVTDILSEDTERFSTDGGAVINSKVIPVEELHNKIAEHNKSVVTSNFVNADVQQPQSGMIELDANNLRYDARIHSSSKEKTAKGLWKRKRGVSDELVAQVEGELRGGSVTVQPEVQVQPNFNPQQFQQPVMQSQPQVQVQPNFNPQQFQQPVAQSTPVVDFNGLMQKISTLFGQQKITPDYLNQLSQKIGQAFNTTVNSLTDISSRPDMIKYAVELLISEGKW